jgi:ribonuclease Y
MGALHHTGLSIIGQAVLCAVAATMTIALAMYFVLLRPYYLAAKRSQQEAQDSERRFQNELQLKANSVLLEAREDAVKIRHSAELDVREKMSVLSRTEDRLGSREEALDRRRSQLEEKEVELLRATRLLTEKTDQVERIHRDSEAELQRIGNLDKQKAREIYIKRVEAEFREQGIRKGKEIESQAVAESERKAKKIMLDVIQRSAVDYVTEATLAVVELPSEDMKGRIIGREGRNIRAFEQVTGVDLIVDETPEAVVISCFDPVRRETARLALMNLMVDGRIHPGRIEELYEKAQAEVARTVIEAGERASERAGVGSLPPRVVEMMGRLRFRTSYAQNVLDHSVEVSRLACNLASELGLNAELAKRAGFLHDIGKALGVEWEGPHALTGMEFLRSYGERDAILNAVGAHHYEIEPSSPESVIVIIADAISAARPGARRENLENYLKRLTALEGLANSFPGVDRSYAVQAGREIRLIVKPAEVDDLGAVRIANEVAHRIERELEYPGQIKVTVIRETRVQQTAK